MDGVGVSRRLRRVALLSAVAVCAGLAGSALPSSGPSYQLADVAVAAVDTAVIARAPAVAVVISDSAVVPYASIEAGLVDVNCSLRGGSAAGTGIVLGSDGVVVTNNHVVAKAISIVATDLADGRRYPVVVLGRDPGHDVAVIRLVGAAGLVVAPIGDSDQLKVGDRVTAIGNAGGRGGAPTVTTGVVTALGQSIVSRNDYTHQRRRLRGMIEVSASVPPGDSGGALLGTSGIVGMDTAAGPDSGFAIPINTVLAIAHGLGAGASSGPGTSGPHGLDAVGQSKAAGTR
jgi:S1-C subfamily serine protease